jgi:glycosyltransferase involved in cell wall biosynthesis
LTRHQTVSPAPPEVDGPARPSHGARRSHSGLRIAMVAACPFPLGRGTPIRIQRQAEALAARGHEVHVVTYSLGTAELVAGVTVHRAPRLPGYLTTSPGPTLPKLLALDPMLVGTLFRLLRTQPIDIIHAHHYEGLLVARAAKAFTRIPMVYDAHTLLGSELGFFRLGLPRRLAVALGEHLDRRLPRLADHVISRQRPREGRRRPDRAQGCR